MGEVDEAVMGVAPGAHKSGGHLVSAKESVEKCECRFRRSTNVALSGSDGVCLASSLKSDLWGKNRAKRNYRDDANYLTLYAGPPGSILLDRCRWRACLIMALFGASTPFPLS